MNSPGRHSCRAFHSRRHRGLQLVLATASRIAPRGALTGNGHDPHLHHMGHLPPSVSACRLSETVAPPRHTPDDSSLAGRSPTRSRPRLQISRGRFNYACRSSGVLPNRPWLALEDAVCEPSSVAVRAPPRRNPLPDERNAPFSIRCMGIQRPVLRCRLLRPLLCSRTLGARATVSGCVRCSLSPPPSRLANCGVFDTM